jgi:dTDP-4-amino-4,6-dideoxygalactose transaminase
VAWYEHSEVGYNYRLSNVLAALGRGQLTRLDAMIARRRAIRDRYADALGPVEGVQILDDCVDDSGRQLLAHCDRRRAGRHRRRRHRRRLWRLEHIEARHVWKPMHLQPVYTVRAGPSVIRCQRAPVPNGRGPPRVGAGLRDAEVDRVVGAFLESLRARIPAVASHA